MTPHLLSDVDDAWMRRRHARGNRAYCDPSTRVADCYDPAISPGARSWFRSEADELLRMARAYTRLLDRYEVPWVELRTPRPGRIVYADQVQVVAVPYTHDQHWPVRPVRQEP